MSLWFTILTVFLLLTIGLGMWRIIRGPAAADRILTAMLFGTTGVGVLLLLHALTEKSSYLDIALVFSLLGAMTAVTFVRLSEKPKR